MSNSKRKINRAKLRKKGHLHEKKSQYIKPDITGTIKRGITSIASDVSNVFLTTACILRQIPNELHQMTHAVKEDPGVVISHTLIGTIGGVVFGSAAGLGTGQSAQDQMYGQKLNEFAKQNVGCEYFLNNITGEDRSDKKPIHKIFCPGNLTLQNGLALSALKISYETVPSLPYIIKGASYGISLGALAGLMSGSYQALLNQHKRKFNPDFPKHDLTAIINVLKKDCEASKKFSQKIKQHLTYAIPLGAIFSVLYGYCFGPATGMFTAGLALCAGAGGGLIFASSETLRNKHQSDEIFFSKQQWNYKEIDLTLYDKLWQRNENLFNSKGPTMFNKIGSSSVRDGKVPDMLQAITMTAGSILLLNSLGCELPFVFVIYGIEFLSKLFKYEAAMKLRQATKDELSTVSIFLFLPALFSGTFLAEKLADFQPSTKIGLGMASLIFSMLSEFSDLYKMHTGFLCEIEATLGEPIAEKSKLLARP